MEKMIKPQQLIKFYEKALKNIITDVKNSDPEKFIASYMSRVENGFKEKGTFDRLGFSLDFTDQAFELQIENGDYEVNLKDLSKNRSSAINKLKKDYINILKSSEEFENHVLEAFINLYNSSNIRNVIAQKLKDYGYFEFYSDAYDILKDYEGDLEMANEAIRNEPFFSFIEKEYGKVRSTVDLYEPIYKIGVSARNASEFSGDGFFDFV